jgi:hypothetical protein
LPGGIHHWTASSVVLSVLKHPGPGRLLRPDQRRRHLHAVPGGELQRRAGTFSAFAKSASCTPAPVDYYDARTANTEVGRNVVPSGTPNSR